jgi:hypothetical protein
LEKESEKEKQNTKEVFGEKKKKNNLILQRKKEKLENRDSCHLLSIKKRRALYL